MIHIDIITIGRPQLGYAVTGFDFYVGRLRHLAQVEVYHIKENKDADKKVLAAIGKSFCMLLDEKGKEFTSIQLAQFLANKQTSGISHITVVIGGPDGHTPAIRERADFTLALSRLTFPHDLATLITTETLYRALSINSGHPYHRE